MQENENILSKNELPPLNLRIKELIERYANGSVKKFSEIIQLSSSQKINRIFNVDKRNGEFPEASSDILINIANMLSDVDMNWLLTGRDSMFRNQSPNVLQSEAKPVVQADSSGEAAIYYKMYKEEKEGKEALIAENATLKERLRQQETPPVKEPAHPPLIEKLVDAFTPDSLGGSGKDFMRTRNPVPSKTSSASKT